MRGMTERDGAIVLPGRVDIASARVLRDVILEAEGDVYLDASEVSLLTTPGLQVLMAGHDHLARAGRTMTLRAPSAEMRACARVLGVALDRIEMPEGAP